jgi:hypothetical protein
LNSSANSALERRLWVAAGLLALAGYLLIVPAQAVLTGLRARGLLAITVLVLFLSAAVFLVVLVAHSRPHRSEWVLYGIAAATYMAILPRLEVIQERVHFLQYGLLSGIFFLALRARALRLGLPTLLASVAIATIATAAVGWGDEGIQALVPSRVYDLRDVGFNALAGLLAAVTMGLREALRRTATVRPSPPPRSSRIPP